MTKYDKAVSVCFSGHRSVPFAKRRELKQCLKSEIAKAYADGYRRRYVRFFRDSNMMIIVRVNRDGSLFWNGMKYRDRDIDKARTGVLLYASDTKKD